MNRKMMMVVLGASLAVALPGGMLFARGFGGGGGGGGFRGGGGGGGGGGMRGFEGGGMRGGAGGMPSMGRTPSFSSPGSFARPGGGGAGMSSGSRGAAEGMRGGQIDYGSRSGSYDTARGGTINYGAAGVGGRGPEGGAAGRGAYGVQGTTAGGRDYSTAGRAGGAVGPGGNAIGGRSNVGAVSGPNGTAVGGSRSATAIGPDGAMRVGERGGAAAGPGGVVAGGSRGGVAAGPGGVVAGGSRGGVAVGSGGAVAGRSYGASAYRPNGFNAYGGYHQGWVHGYWNGHDNAAWGWRNPYYGAWGMGMGMGLGMGLGYGLSSWGYGSSLYGMGYMPYSNPYYGGNMAGAGQPIGASPYDYSQPINTVNAPADDSTANPAMALFDAGRASFQQGDYAAALQQTNNALTTLPDDTTLHEFRALCLFALGRYDEAAATLYAVLSVGPGWDWTTLIGLYPSVDVYTAQLRALEGYCDGHRDSATARFVLAYQYLTQSHTEAAVGILKQVVALKPGDKLSAQLLQQLNPPQDQPVPAPSNAAPPASTLVNTSPPQGASIAGAWTARPVPDTTVALNIQPGGTFTWQVNQKGKTQQFAGSSTFGDDVLTLVQDKGPTLVGRVAWTDPTHMTFRIIGDGSDDPGLSFSK